MSRKHYKVLIISISLLVLPAITRADAPADALSANHLTAVGGVYVIDDEAPVLEAMKGLRQDKKKVDDNTRQRKMFEAKIAASKITIEQSRKEYDDLSNRLTIVTDVTIHNRMVTRANALVVKIKEAVAARKEAEDKENQLSIEPETRFVDELLSLELKADAIAQKYQDLSSNAAVKAAIDRTAPKLALGPSKEFSDAAVDLKKWHASVESEAISLTERDGVLIVSALLNGEPHRLVLDPGASLVTLPGEMAEALKLKVTDQDPVIELKLADGHVIEGHQISLKSIRVGRFTADNVACVVLAKGLPDAPALLGNSFLSHFVIKIDQKAGQLHLTDFGKSDVPSTKPIAVMGADGK